jgi:hypothetical protein
MGRIGKFEADVLGIGRPQYREFAHGLDKPENMSHHWSEVSRFDSSSHLQHSLEAIVMDRDPIIVAALVLLIVSHRNLAVFVTTYVRHHQGCDGENSGIVNSRTTVQKPRAQALHNTTSFPQQKILGILWS